MSENKAVNSALRAAMGKHKSHKIGAGNPANKAVNDSIRNKFRGNSSQAAIDRVVESARKKEADQAREAAAKAAPGKNKKETTEETMAQQGGKRKQCQR